MLSQGWGSALVLRAEVVELARLARSRQERARGFATERYRKSYEVNGTVNNAFASHLVGCLGEFAVSRLLGLPYKDTPGRTGPDGGVDLVFQGSSVDVKTTTSGVPRLYSRLRRAGLRADLVVLAVCPMSLRDWRNEDGRDDDVEVQARGWVRRSEIADLEVQARETDGGKSIGQCRLHAFSELVARRNHPGLFQL
jgi:hypothetical protein